VEQLAERLLLSRSNLDAKHTQIVSLLTNNSSASNEKDEMDEINQPFFISSSEQDILDEWKRCKINNGDANHFADDLWTEE